MSRMQCGGQTPPGKQHHAGKLQAEKETDTIRDLFCARQVYAHLIMHSGDYYPQFIGKETESPAVK